MTISKKQYKYNAWKADSFCNPIEGTDRILIGESKRRIIQHLAFEEGVKHQHNDMLVRCKDGTMWCVEKLYVI